MRFRNVHIQLGLATATLALVACGGGGSGGGGGGGPVSPGTQRGDFDKALPAMQRDANGYSVESTQLNQIAGAGVATALGVAPNATDTLVAHTPLNEVERIDGSGVTPEDSFFVAARSIAATSSQSFAGTMDPLTNGNGDVYRRLQNGNTGAWSLALDTQNSEAWVATVSSQTVLALTGGVGQEGWVHELDSADNQFKAIASVDSNTPTSAAAYKGSYYVGAFDNSSGAAKLFRVLGSAVEEIQIPGAGGGGRQEVTAIMVVDTVAPTQSGSTAPTQSGSIAPAQSGSSTTVPDQLMVLAVGTFDGNRKDGLGGFIALTDGQDFEVIESFSGAAPTALAFIDNTVYTGLTDGRLLYREPAGDWAEETIVPANDGIFSLLARDSTTLHIGVKGQNGAELITRHGGGAAAAPDVYFLPDVSNILAAQCASCHDGSDPTLGVTAQTVFPLSSTADLDADFTEATQRVDTADPAGSTLLTKAIGQAHGGGVIFSQGDPEYDTFLDWIDQGARKEAPAGPTGPTGPTPQPKLGYIQDVKPIIMAQDCASCHFQGGVAGNTGFILSAGLADDNADFAAVRGETNAAQPSASDMLVKNDGTQGHTGGSPWTAQANDPEWQTIVDWINDGRLLNATP